MTSTSECHPVLYTVDDEAWTISFWDMCEFDDAFPGVIYGGADNLARTMEYASEHSDEPTVFVLDSRMALDDLRFNSVRALIRNRHGIDVIGFRDDLRFTGLFVGAWIRAQSAKYRVILLTAFAREINDAIRNDSALEKVRNSAVDDIVAKPGGVSEMRAVVRRLLHELRRDHSAKR